MPIAALHSPKPPSLRLSLNSNCVLRASQWISFMWLPVSMNDMLSTNWHASLRSKALGALPRKYGMVYRVARSTNRSHNRSCATISNPAEPHGNRNRGGDSDLGMLRKGGVVVKQKYSSQSASGDVEFRVEGSLRYRMPA